MYGNIKQHLSNQLSEIRDQGLYKDERVISTPQGTHVSVKNSTEVLNMCANNYLGLAQHPEIKAAARQGLEND